MSNIAVYVLGSLQSKKKKVIGHLVYIMETTNCKEIVIPQRTYAVGRHQTHNN